MGMLEKGGGERAEESGGEDDELDALEAQERRNGEALRGGGKGAVGSMKEIVRDPCETNMIL